MEKPAEGWRRPRSRKPLEWKRSSGFDPLLLRACGTTSPCSSEEEQPPLKRWVGISKFPRGTAGVVERMPRGTHDPETPFESDTRHALVAQRKSAVLTRRRPLVRHQLGARHGAFGYGLGRQAFTLVERVRVPYALRGTSRPGSSGEERLVHTEEAAGSRPAAGTVTMVYQCARQVVVLEVPEHHRVVTPSASWTAARPVGCNPTA